MSEDKTITFYLRSPFRERAETGGVNFVNKIVSALASVGYSADFCGNSDLEVVQSAGKPGYSMFYMEEPFHDRALTMRLAYYYPFWRIEKSAKRWEWAVAKTQFDPDETEPAAAARFVARWQKRLYGEAVGARVTDAGYVYLPLQGRLLEHRSFQAMSPVEMIETTLDAESERQIHATLHPKENYTKAETDALDALEKKHSRLSVVQGDMKEMVRNCSYVVTQNSSIAIDGFFHHKPAVLFGKIDFHHIALNVQELGVAGAFEGLSDHRPDYDRYLFWFLQKMSINAGRADAEDQVLQSLRACGWAL